MGGSAFLITIRLARPAIWACRGGIRVLKPRLSKRVSDAMRIGGASSLLHTVIFRNNRIFYLKTVMFIITLSGTMGGLVSSSQFSEGASNGVRAATCAIGAASMVFITMVPTPAGTKPYFDVVIRSTGGLFAFLAGMFWLLDETDGRIMPYIIVLISSGITTLMMSVFTFLIITTARLEDAYVRQRKARGGERPASDITTNP